MWTYDIPCGMLKMSGDGAREGVAPVARDYEEAIRGLQQQLADKTRETDAIKAEADAAKSAVASESFDKARAHEWTLRTLETEVEAQAQWRQGVAVSLQARLDDATKEAEALKQEALAASAAAASHGDDNRAAARDNEWSLRSLEAELEAQAQWRNGVAVSLQARLDAKTNEAEVLKQQAFDAKAEADAAKAADASESFDKARAHEWTLRTLETEVEAQAQWRQGVAVSLQARLDVATKEAEALKVEALASKAAAASHGDDNRAAARDNEWSLRSLEAELEAQAQWRQRVAVSLQDRLDEKTKEASVLLAQNDALRAEAGGGVENKHSTATDVESTYRVRMSV